MDRKEVEQIIERDLRGWKLATDSRLPDGKRKSFTVIVVNGSFRKVVIITDGRVHGVQG